MKKNLLIAFLIFEIALHVVLLFTIQADKGI